MVANLRNGSNSGACNVNCRNTLGNVNWNISSANNAKLATEILATSSAHCA